MFSPIVAILSVTTSETDLPSMCADFSKWKKRKKEGGLIPTIWEALESAGNYADSAYDLYNWEIENRVIDAETAMKEEEENMA